MTSPLSLDWANEVAVVVGFSKPLSALRGEHIGLFWHLIREEYSQVDVTFPTSRLLSPGLFAPPSGVNRGPRPRFLFSSDDGTHDILVQRDRFGVWWHLGSGEGVDFLGVVRPKFDRMYGFFDEFVRNEFMDADTGADFCELSFAGEFVQSSGSCGGSKALTWLKSFDIPGIGASLARRPEFDFTYYYDLSSGIHIEVGGQSFVHEDDESRVIFTFQVEGSQRLGHVVRPEVSSWLASAYQDISDCYSSLVP